MLDDAPNPFAEADVYYPSGVRTFPIWGAHGVALLRRLEWLIRRRLERLGYVEIALPAVCRLDALSTLVGGKTRHVFGVEDGREPPLALAPFSDLQYVEHALSRHAVAPYLSRVFQWSRRYVHEAAAGTLDFGEYVKCEVFSLHRGARQAIAAAAALARAYRALCASDLALYAYVGTRPRRTAFPGTEETWAAELPLPDGDIQTLVVSHRMGPSFFTKNDFTAPEDLRLNSACFSQKLLSAVLMHHRDAHGYRIPPALAPTLGIVIAHSCDAETARALHPHCGAPDRVVRLDRGDPLQEMIRRGAAWVIERAPARTGRRENWRLHARRLPASAPREFDRITSALQAANREVIALARALRRDSRRQADAVEVVQSLHNLARDTAYVHRPALAAPCCTVVRCHDVVVESSAWIPKLLTTATVPRPCLVCGAATHNLILCEAEERYTSFYLPTERVRAGDEAHKSLRS